MLWHAPGVEPPPALLSALEKREVSFVAVSDAYAALAEILVEARRDSGRPVLVLVEPSGLSRAREMHGVLGRSGKGVSVWMYARGANPALRAVVASDVETWPEATRPEVPQVQVVNGLRGRVLEAEPEPVEHDTASNGASTKGLLSREELAMLLGDEDQSA